jgi:hypothetical protein
MTHRRRYIIAAGSARYENLPEERQLPSVISDVALVSSWFVRHGFEYVLRELGESPTAGDLANRLGDWFGSDSRTPYDIVVLYFSGHGEAVDRDAHYLLARDSRFNNAGLLPHTALADDELARLVAASPVQHALIVLDTCYSGAAITGFSRKAAELLARRGRTRDAPFGIYLVSASRPGEKAKEHVFAKAFIEVLQNGNQSAGGHKQAFIDPPAVVRLVNATFEQHDVRQEARWMPATPLPDDLSELIPNPIYDVVPVAEFGTAVGPGGAVEPRDVVNEQVYFSGRDRAVGALAEWLDARGS